MSEERLERIEDKVDILVSGQIELGMRVSKVEESQAEIRAAVMQIAEGHAPHTRQIERGFQQLIGLPQHHRSSRARECYRPDSRSTWGTTCGRASHTPDRGI